MGGRARFRRNEIRGWLRSFCPNETVTSVTDITPDDLKSRGIRALLLDLDNTLTPWQSYKVPPSILTWIGTLKAHGILLCLVSNSRRIKRLQWLSEKLGIPYARGPMKPRRGAILNALRLLEVQPEEAAIMGDQMFTDVWGGNRAGVYTIWVRPLHSREFIGTKISRMLEGWLGKRLKPYREEV